MDVFRSAFSLVIHKAGDVNDADINDLLGFYETNKGITIDHQRYAAVVTSAREKYKKYEKALFICTDGPCLQKTLVNPSESSTKQLSEDLGCPVVTTGCHWQCAFAPVVTAKDQIDSVSFQQCETETKWEGVRAFLADRTMPEGMDAQARLRMLTASQVI